MPKQDTIINTANEPHVNCYSDVLTGAFMGKKPVDYALTKADAKIILNNAVMMANTAIEMGAEEGA